MDYQTGFALALPIAVGLASCGSALGLGRTTAAAMDAIARQPESSTKILINMTIGCAFIEAVAIYALVFAFIMAGKI
jgi:F-type H+-transporting ATPase subunit c